MGDTINQKVLIWARGQIGKQVGDGECWTLPDRALKRAGAQSSTTTGDDDDYVWGDPIQLKDILPGDILQFRDFLVVKQTDTKASTPDGWSGGGQYRDPKTRGHHTAIVDAILGPNQVRILEQHVKPLGPKVQAHTIPLRRETSPSATTYEDFKDEKGKVRRGAKVTRTVTFEVSGSVWAYRPKAAS
jgi:hypothetical protein